MEISPALKVETVAQLQPGRLFLAETRQLWFVGMVCGYPDDPNDTRFLTLGPKFPDGHPGPALMAVPLSVFSFESEVTLRLPVQPQNWSEKEPRDGPHRLLVTQTGSYFRVDTFMPEFINAATGEILRSAPTGSRAYVTSWEIVTTEPEPRVILRYPFQNAPDATSGGPQT